LAYEKPTERGRGLRRVYLLDHEHELALRQAELDWVRELVDQARAGNL
jgi:hypothetical protein